MSEGVHIHLPSIHLRRADGSGFDYEEDLFFPDERAVADFQDLVLHLQERNAELRRTLGAGLTEEEQQVAGLTEEEQQVGPTEQQRQGRIAAGLETACVVCGCSDSQPCPGGCVWATQFVCSRCL